MSYFNAYNHYFVHDTFQLAESCSEAFLVSLLHLEPFSEDLQRDAFLSRATSRWTYGWADCAYSRRPRKYKCRPNAF